MINWEKKYLKYKKKYLKLKKLNGGGKVHQERIPFRKEPYQTRTSTFRDKRRKHTTHASVPSKPRDKRRRHASTLVHASTPAHVAVTIYPDYINTAREDIKYNLYNLYNDTQPLSVKTPSRPRMERQISHPIRIITDEIFQKIENNLLKIIEYYFYTKIINVLDVLPKNIINYIYNEYKIFTQNDIKETFESNAKKTFKLNLKNVIHIFWNKTKIIKLKNKLQEFQATQQNRHLEPSFIDKIKPIEFLFRWMTEVKINWDYMTTNRLFKKEKYKIINYTIVLACLLRGFNNKLSNLKTIISKYRLLHKSYKKMETSEKSTFKNLLLTISKSMTKPIKKKHNLSPLHDRFKPLRDRFKPVNETNICMLYGTTYKLNAYIENPQRHIKYNNIFDIYIMNGYCGGSHNNVAIEHILPSRLKSLCINIPRRKPSDRICIPLSMSNMSCLLYPLCDYHNKLCGSEPDNIFRRYILKTISHDYFNDWFKSGYNFKDILTYIFKCEYNDHDLTPSFKIKNLSSNSKMINDLEKCWDNEYVSLSYGSNGPFTLNENINFNFNND